MKNALLFILFVAEMELYQLAILLFLRHLLSLSNEAFEGDIEIFVFFS